MRYRSSAFVLPVAAALACSAVVVAQNKDDKKQSDAQKKEIQTIVQVVDGVVTGQPAPNDLGLSWVQVDFLKAQGNKEYAPFTVTVDPSKATGDRLALYWRVVSKSAAAPAPAPEPAKKDDKKDDKNKKPVAYPYEDIAYVNVMPGSGPLKVSRSFTVAPGEYDVYVVAKEPTNEKAPKNAPPSKTSVIKQSVTVPDFWNGELNTSSVIVTSRIDPLPAPLTPQQQADRPYAMGPMELVPVFDMHFSKKAELSTFMLVYNPKVDAASKPDVSVEYNFYQKPKDGPEKFFNKTNPQNLNAQTLPPQFDLAAGHQLQSGQAVPLASFPEGEYRLEIKVTDKIANKTVTRDVNFSVTAS